MSTTYDDLVRAIGVQNDCINDLRAEVTRLTQERDDAEARGEAMFEKLQPALAVAEAEIERLQAERDELRSSLDIQLDRLIVAETEIERLRAEVRRYRDALLNLEGHQAAPQWVRDQTLAALLDAHDAKPLQANQYPDQDDDQQDDVEEGLGHRQIGGHSPHQNPEDSNDD